MTIQNVDEDVEKTGVHKYFEWKLSTRTATWKGMTASYNVTNTLTT